MHIEDQLAVAGLRLGDRLAENHEGIEALERLAVDAQDHLTGFHLALGGAALAGTLDLYHHADIHEGEDAGRPDVAHILV